MKKIGLICLAVGVFSLGLFAQEYIMDDDPDGIVYMSGTAQITGLSGGDWDGGYYDLILPSAYYFYYYGKKVTHLRIFTDGYVVPGFGSAPTAGVDFSNDPLPDTTGPNPVVAPLWDDYDFRVKGGLYYRLGSGSDVNFVVVEWRGVPHYSDPTSAYTFSVTFCNHTHTNLPDNIVFTYADTDSGTGVYDHGVSATIGVEHYAGTQGENYSYNTASVYNNDDIQFSPFVPIYGSTLNHADADTYPDIVIFRPDAGAWFFKNSDGSTFGPWYFGTKGDIALPGDYDGDGDADECVYRPGDGNWFGSQPSFIKQWGASADIPVPADFNGDGQLDIAVFRPSDGIWFIYYRATTSSEIIYWGTEGDIPLPADYDNDGKADACVYRPSNNHWFIRKSSNPASYWIVPWGTDGDVPMPGNFNSTSYSTITVFRPSNGYWFSYDQVTGGSIMKQFGQEGDQPVPCDENSGLASEQAVFRPQIGAWFIISSYAFPSGVVYWGTLGDKPRYRHSFLNVAPKGDPDIK